MKPTTELFDLIKSLTPSEKRYFKLNASLQKGNKNYLRLFNAIEKQKIYDEKALRNKYKGENFIKNLTFTKNYLYRLLFRSLNSFYNEKSVDSKLNNTLLRCKLMYGKALFPEFFKNVSLGKKLAVKFERFAFHIEFLELERQLTRKEEVAKKDISEVYDEEIEVIEKIRNINIYKRAVSALLKLQRMEGVVRNKFADKLVSDVVSRDEFSNEGKAKSITAKEKFYFALTIANDVRGNPDEAFHFNKKRFELISSNREIFQKYLFDNYKDSFTSLIFSASAAGKFSEAQKLILDYKRTLSRNEHKDIDTLLVLHTATLCREIADKNFNKKTDPASAAEKYLIKFKGKITIDNYNYLYFLIVKYNFAAGNFQEALRIINELFAIKTLKFTIHLESYARMLNLLIHYRLGNYKLLQYSVPAVRKYLKSKGKLFKTENAVLNFLKKVNYKSSESERLSRLKHLKKELMDLKNDRYEKNGFVFIDYYDFL